MAFMAVEVCIWHLWLLSSMYVIDGCGGLYMAFMSVEVCMRHLWLQSSIYVIDSCGGLYMAFMAVEVCICQGPIYGWYIGCEGSWCQYILFFIFLSRFQLLALILLLWSTYL